ncbi:MAG: hypothetical protein N3E49_00840 [Bacteroidia bacterium]|nr:hypothetical protein [Bacteroidia bacterium]
MRLLLLISGGAALTLCSPNPPSAPESMQAKVKLEIPVEQLILPYCPECEMSFHRFPIADTLTYDGKLYGFCSEGCKKAFAKRMGI